MFFLVWSACTTAEQAPSKAAPEATSAPEAPTSDTSAPTGTTPSTPEGADPAVDMPIVFIHGINGDASNWDLVIERLIADGWPEDRLFARTFDDPEWGCNVDNASTIDTWVQAVLEETGAERVNLVAHSMGALSSRYYVKNLGGQAVVNTYATLGGMHHGLLSACSPDFPFKPCVWEEICSLGDYVAQLDEEPATPGELHWVSIYGTADETVPSWSSELDGAENISIEGVEHDGASGLQADPATYAELSRVLRYPAW